MNDPFPMTTIDFDATRLLSLWKDTPAGYVQNWLLTQGLELYYSATRRRVMMRDMSDKRKELIKKRLGGYQGIY